MLFSRASYICHHQAKAWALVDTAALSYTKAREDENEEANGLGHIQVGVLHTTWCYP